VRGAGEAALTSVGKVYDAGSKLSEKRKEIENLKRTISWFDEYVAKEAETLRSYYDELEQME